MNIGIIVYSKGTYMGTQNKDLEIYLDLWEKFEELLNKKHLNLSSFAKKWEKFHDAKEDDYIRFYQKLKKKKERKFKLKSVKYYSIVQLEDYIKFLDEDYVIEEMRDDESYENWFD